MQDQPFPHEIMRAVAKFLKTEVAPATTGHTSFQARVCANALEIAARDIENAPKDDPAELARLRAILGMEGDLISLNETLSQRIANREIDLDTPGLKEHLWLTTLAKLAVDQPTYAAYRAEAHRAAS
jgi:Domain of unknown function (DUF6285)